MEQFIISDGKKLRLGYTTGSCAAAAVKAAAVMALTRESIPVVELMTPKGITLTLHPEDASFMPHGAGCAIQKDAGDDPDITNGMRIYGTVILTPEGLTITGGDGVGKVTKPGLACAVGEYAINPVPQRMIRQALQDVAATYGYHGGFAVTISIPGGAEVAQKTFNPRLGIVGGLSILGTSGIVEPMSEKALIATIQTEMDARKAAGQEHLLAFFGNYGVDFSRDTLGLAVEQRVTISNYVGEMLDYAVYKEFSDVLLIGHIGKLVKVAQGIMNTHSRYADGRTTLLALEAMFAGAPKAVGEAIYNAVTTDEALRILQEQQLLRPVMKKIMEKIEYYLSQRVHHEVPVGAIIFSNVYGVLGYTKGAKQLLAYHRYKEETK